MLYRAGVKNFQARKTPLELKRSSRRWTMSCTIDGQESRRQREMGHAGRHREESCRWGAITGEQATWAEAKFACKEIQLEYFPQLNKSISWIMDRRKYYLSTACWIRLIQLFRSSLELVWISYISGPADEALIRNIPLSSLATSLAISFWREITDGFWSYVK